MPSNVLERAPASRTLSARLRAPRALAVAAVAALGGGTAAAQPAPQTVVVTAARLAQPRADVLADVSVLDRTALERSGALDVAELLGRLPGVEFARNGGVGGTASVFVRGGESRHVLVLLDGIRVDAQATGGALWEQLPLDRIERIEVVRGPAAAVYGSDAVGGVVQLFTRRGGPGGAAPSASLTLGSHDTATLGVGVDGAQGALDYALSASHGRSAGFDARPTAATNHDRDGWRRSTLQARVGVQAAPEHRVDASWVTTRLRTQFDGFGTTDDDVAHHALTSGQLAWRGRWSDAASTSLQVGRSVSRYEQQPSFYATASTLDQATLQHVQRVGLHTLTGTLERRSDRLANPATDWTTALEGTRHQDALALGWRADFGAHALQLHARHDRDSEFGGRSTGSAAWGWSFAPHWRASASLATSFRAPTLYQRFSSYGVATLRPEAGRNVEVGVRWSRGGDEASATAWHNEVRDLISFGAPGPCVDAYGCYENVGRARMRGLTVAAQTRVGAARLHGAIDLHDPRNADSGRVLARRAKRFATLGAQTFVAGHDVGADVRLVGARFDDAANATPMGGHALLGLTVSRALGHGFALQARLDNALDQRFETVHGYATGGRALQVTLRWNGR